MPLTCGPPRNGVSTAADIHRTPNVARRAQVAAHEIGHGWAAVHTGTLQYGDTDVDGDVDTADSLEFYANWTGALPSGTGGKRWDDGDFDGDADVDAADQSLLIGGWTGALPAPKPELSIVATAPIADEPSRPGQFALILAPPPVAPMFAKFKVLGSAVHGTDYVMRAADGSEISVVDGVASVMVPTSGLFTVYIDTTNDSVTEGREIVRLEALEYPGMEYTLSTRRYADVVMSADTAQDTEGSIPEVNVIAIDRTASEPQSGSGGDTATFRVTASPAPSSNITVPFVLSGQALSGSDYTPLNPQSVTIGTAGFADVTISPVAQINGEFTESVTLQLTIRPIAYRPKPRCWWS